MTNFKARIVFPMWVFKLSSYSKGFEGKESLAFALFIVCLIVSVFVCKPSTWTNQRWVHWEVTSPPTLLWVLGCLAQAELNQNYGVASFISCTLASVLSHRQGNYVGVHPNCLPMAWHFRYLTAKCPQYRSRSLHIWMAATVSLLSFLLPLCCLIKNGRASVIECSVMLQ